MNEYTEDYIEQCFQVWYSSNQPSNIETLIALIPSTPEGDKPSRTTLRQYMDKYGWSQRADVLNAKAIEKVEHQLIDKKADMLKNQADRASMLADKAHQYLMDNDFDSSSSALKAYFSSTEEERKVRNVGEMLIKISQMSPEELEAKAMKLLRRKNDAVDGEVIDQTIDQESNGEENER